MRIRPDGTVPPDNPFVGRAGAKPEIWSYGHRNSQGAAIHPKTGMLWIHEHGPRGGDEVNIPLAGGNYGWPVIGYGSDYSGTEIHVSTHQEGMEQPIWVMRVAPSGMAFYNGDLFPDWNGSLFLGGLSSKRLVRLTLNGDRVVAEEHLLTDLGERLRDVRQGPDGALWLLTDSPAGRILRLRKVRRTTMVRPVRKGPIGTISVSSGRVGFRSLFPSTNLRVYKLGDRWIPVPLPPPMPFPTAFSQEVGRH